MSAPRDVAQWLDTRTPAPPPALARRLRTLVGSDGARPAHDAADVTLEHGVALLAELLREGCLQRASAVDLLAADALVTSAFEAAADDPDALEARARHGMSRLAAVARTLPGRA